MVIARTSMKPLAVSHLITLMNTVEIKELTITDSFIWVLKTLGESSRIPCRLPPTHHPLYKFVK